MPTSVELRQQRAQIVHQMRAIADAAENENRDLEATERETFDAHEVDYRGLTGRIDRQEAQEQREADAARPLGDAPETGAEQSGTPEDRSRQVRSAFLAFVRRGRTNLAPEQRALVENTAGEILVPEDLEAEILRSTPEITVMRGIATVRPTVRDRVRRRALDEVSTGWGKLETGAQTLVDSMPGVPTEDFTYIEDLYGLAKIGEDEFDDSDVNLEGFVRDSFTRACGEAEDKAFTVGTGHALSQPIGVMTAGGGVASVTAAAAAVVGIDDFLKLVYAVPAQYTRNAAFVVASSTELAVRSLKDTTGNYMWQPAVAAGRPNTFLGYPMYRQDDVAAVAAAKAVAAFGDFAVGYRVYDRLGMTVQRLNELYAEQGMVGFKIRKRVGGDVVRPDALRLLTTATA